jgi:calcineurin-like phosphoesterase family protein
MTVFFTSDEHYGHANIIRYCARPFADVSAMDEALIARHNAVVGPDDDVWHLGDFVFKGDVAATLARLNGRHRLVAGNHDRCHPCHTRAAREVRRYLAAGFLEVHERVTIELPGIGPVLLCHLPTRGDHADERYKQFRPEASDGWLLHGHIHELWKRKERMINVGVDVWDFAPVSAQRVAEEVGTV